MQTTYSVLQSNLLRKIYHWGISPFTEKSRIFWVWFALMTLPDIYYWITIQEWIAIPYFISRGYAASYLFTLLISFLPNKSIKYIYISIISTLIFVFFIVDLFCISSLHDRYSYDMTGIILGTNMNEALEFLHTYLSGKLACIIVCVILILCLTYRASKKIHISKCFAYICLFLLIPCLFFAITNTYPLNGIYAKYHSFFELPRTPNLKALETNPNIVFDVKHLPHNVVVIIGEAYAKSHCSLYGYKKKTCPNLEQLEKDSSLLVFQHVTSPATHTLQSFQYILNTYQLEGNNTKFEKCVTLPNVAKHAGYKTIWISNQSKHGLNDNLVGEFANLCDEEYFAENKFTGLNRKAKDGELIPIIQSTCRGDTTRKFYFIHLMGSHFDCRQRYPDNFAIFNGGGYFSCPEHQRKKLAEYDNSVLYNDFVINTIIRIFKNTECIIFYFPDHGMDIFETSNDWCGHARDNDSISTNVGKQIPFIIYFSKKYEQRFHHIIKPLRKSTDNYYCTDKFIYTVMDVMGISFKNNNDVAKHSILTDQRN